VPRRLLRAGRFAHRFYTRAGALFERSARTVRPPGRLRYGLLRTRSRRERGCAHAGIWRVDAVAFQAYWRRAPACVPCADVRQSAPRRACKCGRREAAGAGASARASANTLLALSPACMPCGRGRAHAPRPARRAPARAARARAPGRVRAQGRYEILRPKRTSLRRRVPEADAGALAFLKALLTVDPAQRPTAAQALQHPWLACAPWSARLAVGSAGVAGLRAGGAGVPVGSRLAAWRSGATASGCDACCP